MDYYGYFPTFNFLTIETQLIATLIGLLAIIFIFWFRFIYDVEIPKEEIKDIKKFEKLTNIQKKNLKRTQRKLTAGALGFLILAYSGIYIIVDDAEILYSTPTETEYIIVQNKSISSNFSQKLNDTLYSAHIRFIGWTLVSFFYAVFLITTSLDVITEPTVEKEKKKRKTKGKKNNVQKIKRLFGGR
jgi:predicted membrane protein